MELIKDQNFATIIKGGKHTDTRGSIRHFNDFDLSPIKRFYILKHLNTSVIRAWLGHKVEKKWFHVISGSFKIVWVAPDNWENPSMYLEVNEACLCANNNDILHIPCGFATGFQALKPNSELIVFSDYSLTESLDDDYRFDKDLWYKW